ncbi:MULTISPECIES: hypothetical protein [Shewanella]|jgi:methylthioribose-1-phosphate isomerase|uniref:hypothetical protein n=1 Tax=Shewanella TaxID=22 RepID=UPI00014F8632|nr:hypothetical protein [Shewanella baltica]ABS08018.1 hypothetical protein Shew185_1875 [Shewanella baltica OS185]
MSPKDDNAPTLNTKTNTVSLNGILGAIALFLISKYVTDESTSTLLITLTPAITTFISLNILTRLEKRKQEASKLELKDVLEQSLKDIDNFIASNPTPENLEKALEAKSKIEASKIDSIVQNVEQLGVKAVKPAPRSIKSKKAANIKDAETE